VVHAPNAARTDQRHDKMAEKRIRVNKRFLFGFLFGLGIGAVTLLVIGTLIPEDINPETASNFFFASTAVNATLLVAMAITISSILDRTPERARGSRMLFLVAQLVVVFLGLVVSGIGILIFNPANAFDNNLFVEFVNIVFTTWVVGFVLLIAGIWVSIMPGPDASIK
jgi:hypothetical protein